MNKLIPRAFSGMKSLDLRTRDLIQLYGADNYAKFRKLLENAYNQVSDLALKAEAQRRAKAAEMSRGVTIVSKPLSILVNPKIPHNMDVQQLKYMARNADNFTPEDTKYFDQVANRAFSIPVDETERNMVINAFKPKTPTTSQSVTPQFRSFGEAFKYYRNQGARTFDYKGKKYTTELASSSSKTTSNTATNLSSKSNNLTKSTNLNKSVTRTTSKLALLSDTEMADLIDEKNKLNSLSARDKRRGIVGRREDGKVARIIPSDPLYRKYIRNNGTFDESLYHLDQNRDAINLYNKSNMYRNLHTQEMRLADYARKHGINYSKMTPELRNQLRIKMEQSTLPRHNWSKEVRDLRYNLDTKNINGVIRGIEATTYMLPSFAMSPGSTFLSTGALLHPSFFKDIYDNFNKQ